MAGLLEGTVVFGNGEPNETTLAESEAPYFIAAYNLDGTLALADYLDASPGLAGLAVSPAQYSCHWVTSGKIHELRAMIRLVLPALQVSKRSNVSTFQFDLPA